MLAATEIVERVNTNMNFSLAQKMIAGEKISLNVSRYRNRPACMAVVLTLRPVKSDEVVKASQQLEVIFQALLPPRDSEIINEGWF